MPRPEEGLPAGRLFRWQMEPISQPFLNPLGREPIGYRKGGLVYDHLVPGSTLGRYHRGVDLAAPIGTPVRLALSGVARILPFDLGGFGYAVQCEGQRYVTTYGHLSKVEVFVSGPRVHGDLIGESGSTGNSTGPHIHWEVFDKLLGAWMDPWLVV